MLPCPMCHGDGEVIETRRRSDGTRRRRRRCRECGHRWTIADRSLSRQRANHLKPEEVDLILSTVDRLTTELNCSRASVVSVLRRADRQPRLSCLQCKHWSGQCGMGFPDPDEEGPGVAQWCNSYEPS